MASVFVCEFFETCPELLRFILNRCAKPEQSMLQCSTTIERFAKVRKDSAQFTSLFWG